MLKLYIGNKNYSSWSMRPWVLMRQAGIEFEEVMVRFDSFSADSNFKQRMSQVSPTAQVPVLVDGDLIIWDTLAIAEYLAEYAAHRASHSTCGRSTGLIAHVLAASVRKCTADSQPCVRPAP